MFQFLKGTSSPDTTQEKTTDAIAFVRVDEIDGVSSMSVTGSYTQGYSNEVYFISIHTKSGYTMFSTQRFLSREEADDYVEKIAELLVDSWSDQDYREI